MYDLLLPELFASDGGIQAYSRQLLMAFQVVRPNHRLRVFIKNDFPCHIPSSYPGRIRWYPCQRSNIRLASSLLKAGYTSKPRLLFSAHPNFAPLQIIHRFLYGTPSCSAAHGIDAWCISKGFPRFSLRNLNRLLPVSRFTAFRLQEQLGSTCPPLSVFPNTYDSEHLKPQPRSKVLLDRYQLTLDQPIIVTLSRLSRSDSYKHIDRLLDALSSLIPLFPALRLLVCGDGDDRQRLELHACSLGIESSVIFAGRIPESELADHLRLGSVFALPSSGEGFGIVFLEALACGVPVLAGNRDGSTEPLADGRLGMLVDPELPLAPALSALLLKRGRDLWFQPELLSRSVAEHFGFDSFCQRLDSELRHLEAA